ncbi:hypothetical protein, partial [Pseudomonas savastanoi]
PFVLSSVCFCLPTLPHPLRTSLIDSTHPQVYVNVKVIVNPHRIISKNKTGTLPMSYPSLNFALGETIDMLRDQLQ